MDFPSAQHICGAVRYFTYRKGTYSSLSKVEQTVLPLKLLCINLYECPRSWWYKFRLNLVQKNAKSESLFFYCCTMMGRMQQGARKNPSQDFRHRMSAPDFHCANWDLIWSKKCCKWTSGVHLLSVMDKLQWNTKKTIRVEDTSRENRTCHCIQLYLSLSLEIFPLLQFTYF